MNPDRPEQAWVLRRGRAVLVLPMSGGDCRFVRALQVGATLGEATATAAAAASDEDADAAGGFDLTRCLAVLLREQVLTGIT